MLLFMFFYTLFLIKIRLTWTILITTILVVISLENFRSTFVSSTKEVYIYYTYIFSSLPQQNKFSSLRSMLNKLIRSERLLIFQELC